MKKRRDLFFGLHFDFHAHEHDAVADVFDPESFERMLDEVKPDFVQCDTKGHPGISSYPTKVGTPSEKILHDVPALLRKLTRERGIALYAHHSGVYDRRAAADHPDWAIADENGNVSDSYMSVFSPYADEILIPQIKELRDVYGFDGAWIDGECWACREDHGPYALAAYREKYGCGPDGDASAYREFCRQGFRDYVAHYVEETGTPDFEITSNWLFSRYMPEAVTVSVPFLSGDYSSKNSLSSARENGRYLAARGMTWDLMAWGFSGEAPDGLSGAKTLKEENELCQEASAVLALGGGFQVYYPQLGHGGKLQTWAIPRIARLARFCREREVLHGSAPCSDAAILVPDERTAPDEPQLFNGHITESGVSVKSWLEAMCAIGLSPDVVYEADRRIPDRIKLLVVPDTGTLSEDTVRALRDFTKRGGKLVADSGAARFFTKIGSVSGEKVFFVSDGEGLCGVTSPLCGADGAGVIRAYEDNFFESASFDVCVEKDGAAIFLFDFSKAYATGACTVLKNVLRLVLSHLGYTPAASVSGSSYAELSVTRKGGDLFATVVNICGDHRLPSVRAYGEIPPLYGVTVELEDCGKEVSVLPEKSAEASVRRENGRLSVTLGRLDVCASVRVSGYFD